jgi:sarcosine oxidase delta subunit
MQMENSKSKIMKTRYWIAVVLAWAFFAGLPVSGLGQVIPPCRPSISVRNDSGACSAVVTYTPLTCTSCTISGILPPSFPVSVGTFPIGTSTATFYSVTGNVPSFCSFSVTVIDSEPPVIICIPVNDTVNTMPNSCFGQYLGTMPVGTDNCPGAITVQDSGLGSGFYPLGITRNVYRVTDAAGNTATCAREVKVLDNQPPVLLCPVSIMIACGADTTPSVTGIASTYDNCTPNPILTRHDTVMAGPACSDTIRRTWTSTDISGNANHCLQTITISPPTLPTITNPGTIVVACDSIPAASQQPYHNLLSGACLLSGISGSSTFSLHPGACGGTMTETWTATDACSRALDTVSRTIVVRAARKATFASVSPDTFYTCTPPTPSYLLYSNGLSGGCAISDTALSTIMLVQDSCGRTYQESWSFTDGCGRTTVQSRTITIRDTVAPVITRCPSDTTLYTAPGSCSAFLSFSATATDSCSLFAISYDIPSGSSFAVGTDTVQVTARDSCGNVSTCSFVVTVVDTLRPTILCPVNTTIACGADTTPSVTGLAFTYDNCTPNPILTRHDTVMAGPACSDTIRRTWTSTDISLNTSQCLQIITISPPTLPTITNPGTIVVDCDSIPAASQQPYHNLPSGACLLSGYSDSSTFSPHPGACGGTMTETWTATDACGRALDTVSRTIVVRAARQATFASVSPDTFYTCTPPTPSYLLYSNGLSGGCAISDTALSTIMLVQDSCGRTYEEHWSFTDSCGRTTVQSRTITIRDTVAPVITRCPSDTTLYTALGSCCAFLSFSATATDSCSLFAISYDIPSGSVFTVGRDTVHVTARDSCGNARTCSFVVTVVDNQPPNIECPQGDTFQLFNGDSTLYFVPQPPQSLADNCGTVTWDAIGIPMGNIFPTGITAITYVAHDSSGNTDSCTFTITVQQSVVGVDCWDGQAGRHGWYASGSNTAQSWTYGAYHGNAAWATNLTGNYGDSRQSMLASPIFDFRQVSKPMVSFSYWCNMQPGDGVVLQATTNSGVTWENVSTLHGGKNWYGASGLAFPLGSGNAYAYGWSGQAPDWYVAAARLEHLAQDSAVQFRFYAVSDATGNSVGFGFRDFCIGSRSKVVLQEGFFDLGVPGNRAAANSMYDLVNANDSDLVMVGYHHNDSFQSLQYAGRAYTYQVPQNPFECVDGIAYQSANIASWNQDSVYRRIFEKPRFQIDSLPFSLLGTSITPAVAVRYLEGDTLTDGIRVHLAVVERIVGLALPDTAEWVLRAMLPSTAGYLIQPPIDATQVHSVSSTWTLQNIHDPDQLGVVAFVQDAVTREVYQAAYFGARGAIVGTENALNIPASEIALYPNPAIDVVHVVSDRARITAYRLIDPLGRVVQQGDVGQLQFELSVSDQAMGIYFLQLIVGKQKITKRLCVQR